MNEKNKKLQNQIKLLENQNNILNERISKRDAEIKSLHSQKTTTSSSSDKQDSLITDLLKTQIPRKYYNHNTHLNRVQTRNTNTYPKSHITTIQTLLSYTNARKR